MFSRLTTIFGNKNSLYPKPTPKTANLNKSQLYQKYQSQKRAEQDFYTLKALVKNTEDFIMKNPHLYSYYYNWLKQAQNALKQYTNVIESPDAVSFSVINFMFRVEEKKKQFLIIF